MGLCVALRNQSAVLMVGSLCLCGSHSKSSNNFIQIKARSFGRHIALTLPITKSVKTPRFDWDGNSQSISWDDLDIRQIPADNLSVHGRRVHGPSRHGVMSRASISMI